MTPQDQKLQTSISREVRNIVGKKLQTCQVERPQHFGIQFGHISQLFPSCDSPFKADHSHFTITPRQGLMFQINWCGWDRETPKLQLEPHSAMFLIGFDHFSAEARDSCPISLFQCKQVHAPPTICIITFLYSGWFAISSMYCYMILRLYTLVCGVCMWGGGGGVANYTAKEHIGCPVYSISELFSWNEWADGLR